MDSTDFLVVGGGVIGIAVALEAKRRHPASSVTLLEKEPSWGSHASGRNSGVLHAGFYYSPESLKAKFSVDGNRRLSAYCRDRDLPLNPCGKLVVASNENEFAALDELFRRAAANGVRVEEVSDTEARELEPRARTYQRALYSPTTSSLDPLAVVRSLAADAKTAGIDLRSSSAFLGRDGKRVRTSTGAVEAGYVINCAGSYADRIAESYGHGGYFRVLPFKGLYLKGTPQERFNMHIYPVPDLRFPFLGVHVTVDVNGRAKLGPSATPAFGREQYGLSDLHPSEALSTLGALVPLILRNDSGLRALAIEEMKKHSKSVMVERAGRLARGLTVRNYSEWGRPGIRPQLVDTRTRSLVMDFVIERDAESCHVLNAISPGFTCALPFAEHVWDRIETPVH